MMQLALPAGQGGVRMGRNGWLAFLVFLLLGSSPLPAYGKTICPPQISIAMATPYDEVMVERIGREREPDEIHIAVSLKTRTLFLCYGTQVIDSFIAQVGMNSQEGDKRIQGDKRTPRGEYYVCLKNADSRYYRALGLSYPNQKDADRGYESGLISKEERDRIVSAISQNAMPDWNTALGGYIEIQLSMYSRRKRRPHGRLCSGRKSGNGLFVACGRTGVLRPDFLRNTGIRKIGVDK
mgnify:CR=1 FL=1